MNFQIMMVTRNGTTIGNTKSVRYQYLVRSRFRLKTSSATRKGEMRCNIQPRKNQPRLRVAMCMLGSFTIVM